MKTRDRRWGDLQSWMPARDILDEAQSPQEQAEQIRKAIEIEPASAILLTGQCTQLAYEGKLDASIQSCAAVDANRFHRVHVRLFQMYEFLQDAKLAAAHLARGIGPENMQQTENIAARLGTAARTGGIRAALEDRLRNWLLD